MVFVRVEDFVGSLFLILLVVFAVLSLLLAAWTLFFRATFTANRLRPSIARRPRELP